MQIFNDILFDNIVVDGFRHVCEVFDCIHPPVYLDSFLVLLA